MKKINFKHQKHDKKQFDRDSTPNIKSTNKSIIDNFPFPKNNISIEFKTNFSPKVKKVKKRNLRQNSYGSFIINKTENNQINNSNYLSQQIKKIKSVSKEKEYLHTVNNFYSNKFQNIQSLNKINNNKGIPLHKKEKKTNSMKGLIHNKYLGNKMIKKKICKENNLQNSYMLSTSNLNININNMDNSEIKNKRKNNYVNTYESNIFSSSREKNKYLSKEEIKFKIEKINNQLSNLINKVNKKEKKLIFKEIEKNYNSLLINHKKNISNIINNLITDNNYLKEKNKEFNNKIELFENKMRNLKQENKLMKDDLLKKEKLIREIQSNIVLISQEFQNLKNKNLQKENLSSERIKEESDSNISIGNNLNINLERNNNQNNIFSNSSNLTKPSSTLNFNFDKNKGFQEEFLQNYDAFSPSWREEVDKMMQRQNK